MSKKQTFSDPAQSELFNALWQKRPYRPYRLHAGDIVVFDNKLCRVLRVSESWAVVIMNRPARDFKTRFDKTVRFQPSPAMFHISPNSEIAILNLK